LHPPKFKAGFSAMRKATSIELADDLDAFVNRKVSEGEYENRKDVVEAGLRLLLEQDEELEAIRQALIEGEESGEAEDFDLDNFLSRMHEKYVAKS
jgi:antitoxin ParD1/3/4